LPQPSITDWRHLQKKMLLLVMCSSTKYPYSPTEGIGGWGSSVRPKHLKKSMKVDWNFQRNGRVLEKIPSMREV